jgi:hypothetical protein
MFSTFFIESGGNAEIFDYFCKHRQTKRKEHECNFTQPSVELPTGAFTHGEQSTMAGQTLDGGCEERGKEAA